MNTVNIDDIANYMFLSNKNNNLISLSLPLLDGNKDLFYFFLDLFCKGLVILFGYNNRVPIENVTIYDFEKVKEKMACAGINIILNVTTNNNLYTGFSINFTDIEFLPQNLNLRDYEISMITPHHKYKISFDLTRI